MVQMVELEGQYTKPAFYRVIIDNGFLRLNNIWYPIQDDVFGENYIEIGTDKVKVTVMSKS